jgi:hypothetical protein
MVIIILNIAAFYGIAPLKRKNPPIWWAISNKYAYQAGVITLTLSKDFHALEGSLPTV